MKLYCFSLLMLAMMVSCTSISKKPDSNLQVKTNAGIVEGVFDTTFNVYKYLGVPYAKPPVNELRWKEPQALEPWQGVKETKNFENSPVQINVYGDMVYRSDTVSEDCLYLNIWKPEIENNEPLPVLVYFYGGGFRAGCGSEGRYDGASLAQKGIITLTVNYRLNIFGFFSHPELSKESPYGASGNYGLLDQAFALQWVKDNIAAFGGNPEKITIAGESAGSVSVSSHMTSPLSKHLIAGAIGQSGAAINPTAAPIGKDSAEKKCVEFMNQLGFSNFSEFRKLNTEELFNLYLKIDTFRFPTVIDNYFYDTQLPEVFELKEQAQIPLLLGWTSAELPGMVFMEDLPYSKENFILQVKKNYPDKYRDVLKLYPHNNEDEVEQSATDLTSDRWIVYSTWKWYMLHAKNSDQPVYRYVFNRIRPSNTKLLGAPHASDIEYFMSNLHLNKVIKWNNDDYKVAQTASDYTANFIKTGNPNGENLPEWKAANSSNKQPYILNIDLDSKLVNAVNDERFLFHESYYQY